MYYDPMECGMRISKLRMECGKTQQQMADKLNISLDHYRALENGRRGGSLASGWKVMAYCLSGSDIR